MIVPYRKYYFINKQINMESKEKVNNIYELLRTNFTDLDAYLLNIYNKIYEKFYIHDNIIFSKSVNFVLITNSASIAKRYYKY